MNKYNHTTKYESTILDPFHSLILFLQGKAAVEQSVLQAVVLFFFIMEYEMKKTLKPIYKENNQYGKDRDILLKSKHRNT